MLDVLLSRPQLNVSSFLRLASLAGNFAAGG